MKKLVDTSGLSCPQPVVETRQALKAGGFDELEVITDNEAAKENVSRFLTNSEVKINRIETMGKKFHIFASVGKPVESEDFDSNAYPCSIPSKKGKTIFIAKDAIGSGSEELGQKLMKAFLYTLTQLENKPSCLLFMNGGVKLCTEGNDAISNIKTLLDGGTEILVCGTCLSYFGLTEKLQIGVISNMYDIAEHLVNDAEVVKI